MDKLFFKKKVKMINNNKVINPKEIKEERKLGEGSFGIVYLGTFRGNKVAIKKMKQVVGEYNDNKMEEFSKEVTMLDKIRSDYIVYFYGACLKKNKICMITEFAQYGSLQDLMDKRENVPIPMGTRIKILLDSAKGIKYLHSNGILHRDIKPGNILVMSISANEKVNAKLTDFGSSRNVDLMMMDKTFTKGIGTPVFMSPEILNGEKYHWQADIYSFAITMFECFIWGVCYPKSEFKMPWKITDFVTKGKRREKPDNMTEDQYHLIDQCWKQNPKERKKIEDVVESLKLQERKIVEEEIIRKTNNIINLDEMETIEEWTKMKLGSIIFDSDLDDWDCEKSTFEQRVLNKSNLIFLIEDEDGNKFGGVVSVKIDIIGFTIFDPNSFVFSLKSNGRLNGMSKFHIKDTQNAFIVYDKTSDWLFGIGDGVICICKEKYKNESYCDQSSFHHNGVENALCENHKFVPKRFVVFNQFNL